MKKNYVGHVSFKCDLCGQFSNVYDENTTLADVSTQHANVCKERWTLRGPELAAEVVRLKKDFTDAEQESLKAREKYERLKIAIENVHENTLTQMKYGVGFFYAIHVEQFLRFLKETL